MTSPVITLDHLTHLGIQNIRIDFAHNRALNEIAKSISAKWSTTHQCFYVENTEENLKRK